jgi:hypothetical protein
MVQYRTVLSPLFMAAPKGTLPRKLPQTPGTETMPPGPQNMTREAGRFQVAQSRLRIFTIWNVGVRLRQ